MKSRFDVYNSFVLDVHIVSSRYNLPVESTG